MRICNRRKGGADEYCVLFEIGAIVFIKYLVSSLPFDVTSVYFPVERNHIL